MNIFRFLKSTKGAIKMANASLVVSLASAGVFYMGANMAANQKIASERRVRTLGELAQTAPQQGMNRQNGMLTSINVRDSRNQLATADDLASSQGNTALKRYEDNKRTMEKLGNMDFGSAAEFSDSDAGLGAGNRQVIEDQTRYSVGNPRAGQVGANASYNAGSSYQGQGGSNANGTQGSGSFTTASMARASGSSFSGTSDPISGGASGGIAATSGGEKPRLSGAMPGGTNIMSQMGLEGALARGENTASFGRDRNGRGGREHRAHSERDELKDILKRSAEADANINASANEGGRAFMANAINSGGISVDGTNNGGTATSSDLASNTQRKLKAIGNRFKGEEDKQKERQDAQARLIWQLVGTVLGSVGTMWAAARFLAKWDLQIKAYDMAIKVMRAMPFGAGASSAAALEAAKASLQFKRKLLAVGMVLAVGAANAALFIKAKQFEHNYGAYGGTWVAVVARIASVAMVAAAVQTAYQPSWKGFIKSALAKVKSGLSGIGIGLATKGI